LVRTCFCLLIFTIVYAPELLAQNQEQLHPIPEVYIDCSTCDITNIRTNITFVNYALNPDKTDIELKIEDLRISGGGREFRLYFSGRNQFEGIRDTLKYISPGGESDNKRRSGLNRRIKIGLIPYVSKTVAVNSLDVFYEETAEEEDTEDEQAEAEEEPEEEKDPWDNWLFDMNIRGSLSGERTRRNFATFGSFEAENITEEHKIRIRIRGEDIRNKIETSGGTRNVNRSWGDLTGTQVFTLNDHAAIGFFQKMSFSTFNNIQFNIEASPAFEFNFFSYAGYSKQRLLLRYRVTPSFRVYEGRTIFNKTNEFIGQQNLTLDFRIDRSWGRLQTGIGGSQFFHDLSLNRFEINNSIRFNLFHGLSVSISGRYSSINDQIAILAGEVTDEEALLDLRRRATSESYGVSIGLSYTFGALSSNATNRRF
jgi:hypothetical protein